jgi:rhodanese-related sulfurtransferase
VSSVLGSVADGPRLLIVRLQDGALLLKSNQQPALPHPFPLEERPAMPNDPFIDIAALPSLGPIRYLDARDPAAFDAGHAPGAVCAPVEEWDAAAKAADTGFNKTAYWDDALGSLGVDPSAIAVAYDGGGMTNAARVWFILQYFGVNSVILNGGWPVLSSASGLPAGAGPSKGVFRAVPGAGSVGLVDREDPETSTSRRRAGVRHPYARRVHRRGHAQPQPWRASPGCPPSVAYRSLGQWRCSSGTGAASHAGAGGVRPR